MLALLQSSGCMMYNGTVVCVHLGDTRHHSVTGHSVSCEKTQEGEEQNASVPDRHYNAATACLHATE